MSSEDLGFRKAARADLPDIVRMLADDVLRSQRERHASPLPSSSRPRGCRMVQLTSDKTRADAIRFYESLGFVPSHEGLKLNLGSRDA